MKKGQFAPFIVFLIVLIIGIGIVLFYNNSKTSITGNVIKQINGNEPEIIDPDLNLNIILIILAK